MHSNNYIISLSTHQKRKTTTISVEVKKSQHKYIIGPKGNTLQEIDPCPTFRSWVSVEEVLWGDDGVD